MAKIKTCLALLIILLFNACSTSTLYRPSPIVIPQNTPISKIQKAVVQAFTDRGWNVEKNWKELTEASIRTRGHEARVRVNYVGNKVEIRYVSSNNLKYSVKNGTEYIHRRYNNWVKNIEEDILDSLHAAGAYSVPSYSLQIPDSKQTGNHIANKSGSSEDKYY